MTLLEELESVTLNVTQAGNITNVKRSKAPTPGIPLEVLYGFGTTGCVVGIVALATCLFLRRLKRRQIQRRRLLLESAAKANQHMSPGYAPEVTQDPRIHTQWVGLQGIGFLGGLKEY